MHEIFRNAGYKVFGLYGFTGDQCHCERDTCKDTGKHPIMSGWQVAPDWSDEQWQTFNELGHFDSGYGVLCSGLLVVDIDPRNGGDMGFLDNYSCGLVVETGGGGLHGYFTVDSDAALVQHIAEYPGIDFKSSGYVVGPGSRHVSGNEYKVRSGSVDQIGPAPRELLDLLARPEFVRVEIEGETLDYSHDDIRDMLQYVTNDLQYEDYIRIGMAVHHSGAPFELWDEWARRSDKYTGSSIYKRWKSFHKTGPVTIGTLLYHAKQGGWQQSVTFEPTVDYEPLKLDDDVDLLRPPGFIGEVAAWIESNNRRPRENLAVAAALSAIGDVIGLKYTDDLDGVSSNLFVCCVAGAGTGKEAPQGCITEILKAAGIVKAKPGNIKSEQEIYRNLTLRSQACFLVIDELGFLFSKIKNAGKSGASYLEGIPGLLMSVQGKANGVLPLSGDMYSDLLAEFNRELAAENKAKNENERFNQQKIDDLQKLVLDLETEGGIKNPFLSLIGFTTRTNFDSSVNYETATNGFLRRAYVIIEGDDAPPMKKDFKRTPLPTSMKQFIMGLYSVVDSRGRIQYNDDKRIIPTSDNAVRLLGEARDELDRMAQENEQGLEALYLGAYENISRVSLILGAPGGLRTAEHVRWAYALTLRDIRFKSSLVESNNEYDRGNALTSRITHYLETAGELTQGVIFNKLRRHKQDDIKAALAWLVERGAIYKTEIKSKRGGKSAKYEIKAP